MSRRIIIFDTTLRDGEQTPGAKLNREQKVKLAWQLARMGVDVIEAGFPCSSPGDLEAVKSVARTVGQSENAPIIAGLARAVKSDIDDAWKAVRHAKRPRIHVFLATSDIHLSQKLKKDRKLALSMVNDAVSYARSLCEDIEFSTEDGSRTEFEYLCEVIQVAMSAGATTINIPDTVGYAVPEQYGDTIRRIKERFPQFGDKVMLSVHCHNDLGMAVANSLAAIKAGADQVECTVNGVGERAGNASLEEIVMALRTRSSYYGAVTGIVTEEIFRTSRMVSKTMNIPVQPNKAIVGANAFSHSSGIHQDGILKSRETYEIMRPEDVGIKEHKLVLTARSGRAAVRHKLAELGIECTDEEFARIHERFKQIADKKKEIGGQDLRLIAESVLDSIPEAYKWKSMQYMGGNGSQRLSSVTLIWKDGKELMDAAVGNGPIDSAFKAIDRIVGLKCRLLKYDLSAVSENKDALAEATVSVDIEGIITPGNGASPDIIEASARAYLNGINRYFANLPQA